MTAASVTLVAVMRFGEHGLLQGLLAPLAVLWATPALAQQAVAAADETAVTAPAYPASPRLDLVETLFGKTVADPYRWLEKDPQADPIVADWVARENAASHDYLASLPQRAWFAAHIRAAVDFVRFSVPKKAGLRYFYLRNSGAQNQAQLFVRTGLDGEPRLLIDPNRWARDGTVALDPELWEPSPDGQYVAYGVQDGGSDWRVLRVIEADGGRLLPDEVRWANDTRIAWVGHDAFLYSRFPAPVAGQERSAPLFGKAVWLHHVGTPQRADLLVYATPAHPDWGHKAEVTADGRFAVITSEIGTDARVEVHVFDLARNFTPASEAIPLVTGFANDWKLVNGLGRRLLFVTNRDAPRYRLVEIDLAAPRPHWRTVVGEGPDTLSRAELVGEQLLLSYLRNATSFAAMVDLKGRRSRVLTLNGIGTASGFRGRPGDSETFYSFTSFTQPPAIYRFDMTTGISTPFAVPRLPFDPAEFVVEQRVYQSRDGTRVPLFLVRRRDVVATGRAVPTLLYGYGGFDIAQTPVFSAARMAWVAAGGAYALANLRGGGEFGEAWHEAGRLAHKQNVFDDFIAAGEYLIAAGVTPKGGLAIQGGSNGGLLVAAVANQRPDLFAAANPAVGVMDMLRFNRWTAGRYWVDDYGHPDVEADFRVLLAYSPYHNIHPGVPYPAILVTTADHDDRVVPAHSFKYTAALQAAGLGPRPQLLRVESRAGHGAGKPTDKMVAESADVLAFLAQWTGLKPAAGQLALHHAHAQDDAAAN